MTTDRFSWGRPQATLGAWLRQVRRGRSLTQIEVAQTFGVTQATYSRWELDEHLPASSRLGDIADFLNADVGTVWAMATSDPAEGDVGALVEGLGRVIADLSDHFEALAEAVGVGGRRHG